MIAIVLGLTPIAITILLPAQVYAQEQGDLSFTTGPAQRQANSDAIAAEVSAAGRNIASAASDVRNLLRSQDIVGPYMAGYGMSGADLGDVLALAYFSAVMLADGGKTDDPTQAQIDGIRALIAKGGSASFASLSNAQKQQTAAIAALTPRDRGRWSKSGQNYRVTFDDGDTDDIEASKLYGPAPKGSPLSGRFKAVSGTSIGTATTLSVDFLVLSPDGSFSLKGSTSSLGTHAIANIDRGAQTGRYMVDGYRIIFEYANGTREEESFVLYDKDFLIIGEKPHYIPDD